MKLPVPVALFAIAASAQQMVSMRTSGDTAILTIRVDPRNFVTVSGAPYSGKRVTIGVQTRADGNRVNENRTVLFYRDSAGRNRTERPVSVPGSPAMITIMDPTLGCEYVLSPGEKTAYKLIGVQVRTEPMSAFVNGNDTEEASAGPTGTPSGASIRREDLGTQTMQGLAVQGQRATTTWPAGTFNHNDREIVTTFESWSARALGGVVISSKTSRPDLTEDYSVSDVKAGDADPSLFAPPADYRIVEESSDFQILIPQTSSPTVTKLSTHGAGPAPISGAPFSGTRTVVASKTLPDGTREEQPERTAFLAWRDSEGRVRTEWPGQGNLPETVEIQDPVAGFTYSLDYAAKVARRTAFTQPAPGNAASGANAQQLGSQVISGVPANGIRTTTARPAGVAPATNQPLTTVLETWIAAKEGVTLLQKTSSADGGGATIAMKHFTTLEPDPSLFRIPATYRIVDDYGSEIAAATAHPPTAPPADGVRATAPANRPGPQESVFTFRSLPGMNLPAVTRAPYSTQSTSQTVRSSPSAVRPMPQPLPSTTTTFRDSMGRTRTERAQGGFAPGPGVSPREPIVLPQVDDPVAGYRYILDPVHQIAHRSVMATRRINPAQANPVAAPATPPTTQTMPSGMTISTESLGSKTIDGILAMGMRTTMQGSPAGGPQGNNAPMNTVMENWTSIQYGAVLRSTNTTPNGTTTTSAKEFSPTEPDPALFQIPPEYRIVDEDGDFSITISRTGQ